MHGHRRRGYALAHPAVAAVEEFVEYAGRTGLGPHVHEADQFGRVYLQVSRLLRDEGETSDQRGVVDLVVNGFPAELNVGLSFSSFLRMPLNATRNASLFTGSE